MQFTVLGSTADDKGTQLEQLTSRLLEAKGYQPSRNYIGPGGLEIDVHATIDVPGLMSSTQQRVLCECKAQKAPVAMTEWLKFVGKLHSEELRFNTPVHGCFIALNGVNGNVRGSFDEIRSKKPTLELVFGQDLRTILLNTWQACEQAVAERFVSSATSRQVLDRILCYRESRLYWAFQFADDRFVVVNANGDAFLKPDDPIVALVQAETSYGTPLDIAEENETQRQRSLAVSHVLATLFIKGGECTLQAVLEACQARTAVGSMQAPSAQSDVDAAANDLVLEQIATLDGTMLKLVHPIGPTALRRAVGTMVFPDSLASERYREAINIDLLRALEELHGRLTISPENEQQCLFLLTHSHSALRWALQPHYMLDANPNDPPGRTNDRHTEMVFVRGLVENFVRDFSIDALRDYYYNKVDIVEIESRDVVRFKSKAAQVVELSTSERIAIMPRVESEGGGLLLLSLVETAPEPWERIPPEA